ncbi:MAG: MFS transporter [Ruminococcaceae bacterium]|nr:MFS transporter [Oscillospiraceae bacterium]
MNTNIRKRAKAIAWMCTLVYFASYLMRINFAVMLVKIGSDIQADKTDLAVVVTGLTIAYGAGQIISGFLGDRFKPQNMLTVGLTLAAVCNVAMYFSNSIAVMTAVWTVNGFAHSMLWPPIVRLMSAYLNDEEYAYSAVRVSWGSSFATILLYLVCPLLLNFMSWRTVILLCAIGGLLIMVAWNMAHHKLFTEKTSEKAEKTVKNEVGEKIPLPKYVYLPIVLIMLGIILQGVLRDGVTNWMPSYLLETFGLPEEKAIVATVILAVFSVISFAAFDFMHRKLIRNEVFCAAVIFIMSVASAGVLYIVNVISASVAVSMILMALIVSFMHGINLMLITVVPKRFIKSGKVSTYSGLLNSCTYIGASISTYGFAAVAESRGWNYTILLWVIVSLLGTFSCLAATPLWKKFRKDYSDN